MPPLPCLAGLMPNSETHPPTRPHSAPPSILESKRPSIYPFPPLLSQSLPSQPLTPTHKHLGYSSRRSKPSRFTGYGKNVFPSAKSPSSTATPAWASPCSPSIWPPASLQDCPCPTAPPAHKQASS